MDASSAPAASSSRPEKSGAWRRTSSVMIPSVPVAWVTVCAPARSFPHQGGSCGDTRYPRTLERVPTDPIRPDTALVRRARRVNRVLAETYPDARCELDFTNPFELLIATVLSAQTTDRR